jgi:NodT family efflux transporter outer membrane factor (OMF) lipoprotein
MQRVVFLAILIGIIIFPGCKTFEPEADITPSIIMPQKFSIDEGINDTVYSLHLFEDSEEIKLLINDALNNNFDLKILNARINQAKALVAKEEAAFSPDLGFSIGGQKQGTQVKKSHGESSKFDGSHSWDGALISTYTADVWGEAEAKTKAQEFNLKAATWDLEESTLELTTTIAQIWIGIISTRNEKRILMDQIDNNKTLLELQKFRFLHGKANALDVSQQHEVLANANSQVPLLEKQERLLLNRLVFLSGHNLIDAVQVNQKQFPEIISLPRVGVPLNLLDNRPDIQAARLRLSSSRWEISAARADLLPSFSVTARALFSSGQLDLLFQNWVATLAGSIAGPIFDGGFRRAEIERVKAVANEQLNIYALIVAGAIREVEDVLITIQKQDIFLKLLGQELEAVRLTLKDARIQYQNGQSSYLNYLVAWTSIQRLERQLISERAIYLNDRIDLYRVLGISFVL